MYKKITEEHEPTLSGFEFENGIQGADLFDSVLLYNLALDKSLVRSDYIVRSNWYRPDLVAKDFYGDTRYEAFVILQAGSIKNIRPGVILKLINKEDLNTLRK